MNWLRVELLRLRSFDWGTGSRGIHWLKDGVAKFSSYYSTSNLASKLGISEEDILRVVDSPQVIDEVEGKSFTISWKEGSIILTWLEEGISEWRTDIGQHYYEEDGRYYLESRMTDKVIYLDGSERIVKDTGDPKRVSITEEVFRDAVNQIRRSSEKEK